MENSARLNLPYLLPQQAQKHVTHNEALRMIDALVHMSAISRSQLTPPSDPAEGDAFVLPDGSQGDWDGKAGLIAVWQDGAWAYFQPSQGWRIWIAEEQSLLVFHSGELVNATGVPDEISNIARIGIGTEALQQARLAVRSDETVLTSELANHRVTINRSGPSDTATILFKTGWVAGAEIGLAGSGDLSFKTSSDGANWTEAMRFNSGSGKAEFTAGIQSLVPSFTSPELDHRARVYIDAINGDDANDGSDWNRAVATVSRLAQVLPLGTNTEIRVLSDLTWNVAIFISCPVGVLKLLGRDSGDAGDALRTITVVDAQNHGNLPGCIRFRSHSNLSLQSIHVQLSTARNASFLNYLNTSGFLSTYNVTLSRTGTGDCRLFGDTQSFVPSNHTLLTVQPSAAGYVANGVVAGQNPNTDWRYPCNLSSFA